MSDPIPSNVVPLSVGKKAPNSSNLALALALAEAGIPVFPCHSSDDPAKMAESFVQSLLVSRRRAGTF
jgi:hypothetical protein